MKPVRWTGSTTLASVEATTTRWDARATQCLDRNWCKSTASTDCSDTHDVINEPLIASIAAHGYRTQYDIKKPTSDEVGC